MSIFLTKERDDKEFWSDRNVVYADSTRGPKTGIKIASKVPIDENGFEDISGFWKAGMDEENGYKETAPNTPFLQKTPELTPISKPAITPKSSPLGLETGTLMDIEDETVIESPKIEKIEETPKPILNSISIDPKRNQIPLFKTRLNGKQQDTPNIQLNPNKDSQKQRENPKDLYKFNQQNQPDRKLPIVQTPHISPTKFNSPSNATTTPKWKEFRKNTSETGKFVETSTETDPMKTTMGTSPFNREKAKDKDGTAQKVPPKYTPSDSSFHEKPQPFKSIIRMPVRQRSPKSSPSASETSSPERAKPRPYVPISNTDNKKKNPFARLIETTTTHYDQRYGGSDDDNLSDSPVKPPDQYSRNNRNNNRRNIFDVFTKVASQKNDENDFISSKNYGSNSLQTIQQKRKQDFQNFLEPRSSSQTNDYNNDDDDDLMFNNTIKPPKQFRKLNKTNQKQNKDNNRKNEKDNSVFGGSLWVKAKPRTQQIPSSSSSSSEHSQNESENEEINNNRLEEENLNQQQQNQIEDEEIKPLISSSQRTQPFTTTKPSSFFKTRLSNSQQIDDIERNFEPIPEPKTSLSNIQNNINDEKTLSQNKSAQQIQTKEEKLQERQPLTNISNNQKIDENDLEPTLRVIESSTGTKTVPTKLNENFFNFSPPGESILVNKKSKISSNNNKTAKSRDSFFAPEDKPQDIPPSFFESLETEGEIGSSVNKNRISESPPKTTLLKLSSSSGVSSDTYNMLLGDDESEKEDNDNEKRAQSQQPLKKEKKENEEKEEASSQNVPKDFYNFSPLKQKLSQREMPKTPEAKYAHQESISPPKTPGTPFTDKVSKAVNSVSLTKSPFRSPNISMYKLRTAKTSLTVLSSSSDDDDEDSKENENNNLATPQRVVPDSNEENRQESSPDEHQQATFDYGGIPSFSSDDDLNNNSDKDNNSFESQRQDSQNTHLNLDAENDVSMIPGDSSDEHTRFKHLSDLSSDAESPSYRKQQLSLDSPTNDSNERRKTPKRSPKKTQNQQENNDDNTNQPTPAKRGRKPRAPIKKKVYEVAYVPQFGAGFGTIYEFGTKFSSLLLPKNKYVENVAIAPGKEFKFQPRTLQTIVVVGSGEGTVTCDDDFDSEGNKKIFHFSKGGHSSHLRSHHYTIQNTHETDDLIIHLIAV